MKTFILAGSNSKLLAEQIAENNNLPILNHRIVHFINSEMKITLSEEIRDYQKCIIVQSTSNPSNDNLVELCLLADTLRREGITEIEAVIPYFGYARQDKQHLPLESVSIQVMANILKGIGIKKVYTVDIHNENAVEKIYLDIQNLSSTSFVAQNIYKELGLNEQTEAEFTIASPDDGGIKRAELFAKNFYQNQKHSEIVSIKKRRHLDKTHYCEAVELRGDINDKKLILIDDVSTSGGTLLNALELCKANGVLDVYAVVIHADFAKGVAEKLENSEFLKIYTTNSIEKTVDNLYFFDKIKVIKIGEVFDL
jgi:ribose-phosphate pyrophosphokinase